MLVAVAAVAVRGRSDRCAYAEDWIDVEQVWGRTVTPNEKSALSSMLGSC